MNETVSDKYVKESGCITKKTNVWFVPHPRVSHLTKRDKIRVFWLHFKTK